MEKPKKTKKITRFFHSPIKKVIGLLALIILLTSCSISPSIPSTNTPTSELGENKNQLIARYDESLFSPNTQIRFQHYSTSDGLLTNRLYDVLQDKTGYIWVATDEGLNRYNAYQFTVLGYLSNFSDTISRSPIYDLYEDKEGHLWMSSLEEGLIEYNSETGGFTIFTQDPDNPNSLTGQIIQKIFQDNTGIFWIGTDEGLNRFDKNNNEWRLFSTDSQITNRLISNKITDIIQDNQGILWIGTAEGLCKLDPNDFETLCFSWEDGNPKYVTSILQDIHGKIWIGTQGNGLFVFDQDHETFSHEGIFLESQNNINPYSITTITEGPEDTIWIGTNKGLIAYNSSTGLSKIFIHQSNVQASISGNSIQALHFDNEGGLWIATANNGLNRLDPLSNLFPHYVLKNPYFENNTANNSILSINEGKSGWLWFGTNGAGLIGLHPDRQSPTYFFHNPNNTISISGNIINCVLEDSSGYVWAGTEGKGLNKLDPTTRRFTRYVVTPSNPNSISSNTILSLYQDDLGNIWVGTDQGLDKIVSESDEIIHYRYDSTKPETISNDIVTSITQDSKGILWIGTFNGLNSFDPETGVFTRYLHSPNAPGISHPIVSSILSVEPGIIWVGTNGGGVNMLDTETGEFISYRAIDGLSSDSILGILQDSSNNLWISTNNGISKLDTTTQVITNYDESDGLQSNYFNLGSYYKNAAGELYFGGDNGYNCFDPERIIGNPNPPTIVFQQITQNGDLVSNETPFENLQEITLEWPNNYFDFEVTSLNFHETEKYQYSYKLENFEENWNFNDTRRYGRYTNIPGGTYTLRVIGSNNDGVWNTKGTAIKIIITPPIWQSWWFLTLVGLSAPALIAVGYFLRVKSLENQSRDLEKQVTERTREINKRRRQIETLYNADEDLYRLLELDELLQVLIDKAVQILGADKGALLCYDENHENFIIQAARGFHEDTITLASIPKNQGVVGWVTTHGRIAAVEDTTKDQRVTLQIIEAERIGAFLQAPIRVGNEIFGALSVDYTSPRSFTEEDKRILASFAQRAGLAIQNAQLYSQAREFAAAQERNRIARELHDAVTQTLFSASLIAEALPALWEKNPEKGKERLDKLRQMSRGALAEMRTMLLELRPAALLNTDLPSLLKQLGEAVTGREGVQVSVDTQGEFKLPSDVHLALYRISQEALNNIIKHAKATKVELTLTNSAQENLNQSIVKLVIRDNGKGFDPQGEFPHRFGLGIMQERATAIEAKLTITSSPGNGTEVVVVWAKKSDLDTGNEDE